MFIMFPCVSTRDTGTDAGRSKVSASTRSLSAYECSGQPEAFILVTPENTGVPFVAQ